MSDGNNIDFGRKVAALIALEATEEEAIELLNQSEGDLDEAVKRLEQKKQREETNGTCNEKAASWPTQGSFAKFSPENDESDAKACSTAKDGKAPAMHQKDFASQPKASFAKYTPESDNDNAPGAVKDMMGMKDDKSPPRSKEIRHDDDFVAVKEWEAFSSSDLFKEEKLFPDVAFDDVPYASRADGESVACREHGLTGPSPQEVLPGAVWEGGDENADDETASFPQEDPEQPTAPSNEQTEEVLVRASIVRDPVLVSASQVTCDCSECCPYGPLTALPVVLACSGSVSNIMAGLFTYTLAIIILGITLGAIGGLAFVTSIVLSCKKLSSRRMRILSGIYMLLAVASLFLIFGIMDESFNKPILAMAIVGFLCYGGAAASTFYLDKRARSQHI